MKKKPLAHKQKIAFVASGGAVKAACFHIGVGLALEKKGLCFYGGTLKNPPHMDDSKKIIRTYVGSSAGSIITAFLASGYTLPDIIKSFLKSNRSVKKLAPIGYRNLFRFSTPNFSKYFRTFWSHKKGILTGGFEAFVKNYLTLGGLFTTENLEEYLRTQALPVNHFEDLVSDLFIVATKLDYPEKTVFCKHKNIKPRPEHHAVYENTVKISEACAASTALPPIYQPYPIKSGKTLTYYYDGEIRETLSTHVAKDMGCDLVIASYTHQPYYFNEEIGSLTQYGMANIMIQAIYQLIEQKIHTARRFWETKRIALETVNQFFKDNQISDKKRQELCDILEQKLNFNKNIDYLFIHPLAGDSKFFLSDHFNLSETYMIKMVQSGFKSAIYHLRNYDFNK